MITKLPENLTPFLVPKDVDMKEFIDAPCPMCGALGTLEPVQNTSLLCQSEKKEEEVDVSGVSCSECEEIFLDEESLELYLNTLLKLQGIKNKRYSLDSGQPVEQNIH